jgi:hypothetical protein
MKLRHKETGEIIDLPEYLPEYEDAKEIARVFLEAAALTADNELPPEILSLKTYAGDIIQVSKITNASSHFPYDKLIRIHLHLPPFTNIAQQNKSTVWTVLVNGMEWSVGAKIFDHVIQKLEWTKQYGWWAITDDIYAIQLEKINPVSTPPEFRKKIVNSLVSESRPQESTGTASADNPPVIQMGFQSWFRKMIAN